MRKVTYHVAASLDGYIAGPGGEVDWLFSDQDYGMDAFLADVDAILIGRKTYELMLAHDLDAYPEAENYVFSRTLSAASYPAVTIVAEDTATFVRGLKRKPGKRIWLVGGGELFRSLLEADVVDEVVVSIHPVLLGRGIALLADHELATRLALVQTAEYETGLVSLHYEIVR